MEEFKRFFLRGLAAVLPTLLTIAIFLWAYHLVDRYIGRYITLGMRQIMAMTGTPSAVDEDADALRYGDPIDEWLGLEAGPLAGRRVTVQYKVINSKALNSPDPVVRSNAEAERVQALWDVAFRKYHLHIIGFLVAIIVVYFVGFFLASFLGRRVWRAVEQTLGRVPFVRAIYPNIKQVTDFLFGEQKLEFSGVVAVPYPRVGIWSIGLLTGQAMRALQDATGDELVSVFVPSSPTPVTGYTITVPRKDVLELPISIDEALRFIISGGVIRPDTRLLPPESASSTGDSV
jgi:uncharacterized membrane protein